MADLNKRVYEFVKENGPVLPVQVSKVIESNIIFASAILAELLSGNKVRLSHGLIGGSKLYYVEGQEKGLYDKLYNHLNSRESQALDLLKDNKVLREKELEPWQRVALRDLKDFAIPLAVKHDDNTQEIFWKYHMVDDKEAKEIITSVVEPIVYEDFEIEDSDIVLEEDYVEEVKVPVKKPVKQVVKEKVEEVVKEVEEEVEEVFAQEKPTGNYYSKTKRFFDRCGLDILQEVIVKKSKEFDFVVNVPTNIGPLRYYIKSKDKKSVNEGDLSLAVSEAKHKKLPVVFLSSGRLTKKAKDFLNTRVKNQIIFKKI